MNRKKSTTPDNRNLYPRILQTLDQDEAATTVMASFCRTPTGLAHVAAMEADYEDPSCVLPLGRWEDRKYGRVGHQP